MRNQPGFGPAAHERIALKSRALAQLLKRCSKQELEMLIRYYVHGHDAQQVIEETGCTAEEFKELRSRMRAGALTKGPLKGRAAAAS